MPEPQFISVELAIHTDAPCDDYVNYFSSPDVHVCVVPSSTQTSHVYFDTTEDSSPDAAIGRLCEQLSTMPESVRLQWEAASIREFCIGYLMGDQTVHSQRISVETLKKVVAFGAGISWALYPALPEEGGAALSDADSL